MSSVNSRLECSGHWDGIENLPPTAFSLRPKPMERQLLEQAVKKEDGFTFWEVQGDITMQSLIDIHLAVLGMCLGFLHTQKKFILYNAFSLVSSGLLTLI